MASEETNDLSSMPFHDCINTANRLINLCHLSFPQINYIEEINSIFIVLLFENITGYEIPDLLSGRDSIAEAHNVQSVIDCLSLDLLGLSLSHMTGESIVSGNVVAISNLLEVLEAVAVHFLPQRNKEENLVKAPSTSSSRVRKSPKSTDDEDASTNKILKRKICKHTLRKSKSVPIRKRTTPLLETTSEDEMYPSEFEETKPKEILQQEKENLKPVINEKDLKNFEQAGKFCETHEIEKLYEINYEQKIESLVLDAKRYPRIRAQQMKRNYLHSLKSPMKRKSTSYCRKSFLLPYNLRHTSTRRSPRRNINKVKDVQLVTSSRPARRPRDAQEIPLKIQSLLKEFPGVQFPKNTLDLLTKQYYHHLGLMHKELKNAYLKKPPNVIEAENEAKQQSIVSDLIAKNIKHMNTLKEINDHKACENRIKYSLRDARLRSAAMKKYFNEFHVSMKHKLQKRNFTEELIVQETFREMLKLQKEEVQQLCKQIKEADNIDLKNYKQYLSALQNLYKDQLSMLTESLDAEKKALIMRLKSHKQGTEKLHRNIRDKLQKDVRSLQEDILEAMKDTHFRELDAENFISSIRERR